MIESITLYIRLNLKPQLKMEREIHSKFMKCIKVSAMIERAEPECVKKILKHYCFVTNTAELSKFRYTTPITLQPVRVIVVSGLLIPVP